MRLQCQIVKIKINMKYFVIAPSEEVHELSSPHRADGCGPGYRHRILHQAGADAQPQCRRTHPYWVTNKHDNYQQSCTSIVALSAAQVERHHPKNKSNL